MKRPWRARGIWMLFLILPVAGVVIQALRFCAPGTPAPPAQLALPALRAPVVDTAGTFTREEEAALTGGLERLRARAAGAVFVVVVATTGPEPIEAFTRRLAGACDAGRAPEDRCSLIVADTGQERVWIEAGPPLERFLADAKSTGIEVQALEQSLREGRYFAGLQTVLYTFGAAVPLAAKAAVPFSAPAAAVEVASEGEASSEGTWAPSAAAQAPTEPPYDPFENPWVWGLTGGAALAGVVLRVLLSGHGFLAGVLGLAGGGGVLAIAQVLLHDVVLGLAGAILLATIAMGFGWLWVYLLLRLGLELLLGGIFGGGGGSGGGAGGGGSFGGGGASGSW